MKLRITILLIVFYFSFNLANAQIIPDDFPQFVIKDNGGAASGYLLGGVFSANHDIGSYNFILDSEGNSILFKESKGLYCQMHPSGLISAPKIISGNKNIYMIYDNDFDLIDSVQMANGYFADSHDFKILPNGHFLMVAYNDIEIDMSKIVEGGHPNANVTQAIIQELDANKNPVFQWKSLDYILVTDSYSDLTAKNIDYIHVNSMFIDDDGNLLISCRSTSEIIKISRQTGEIIWRIGGKNNQFTFLNEHEENAPMYFAWQHDAKILANGNLLFFDNGSTPNEETRAYSRAVEYEIDDTNKTAKLVWEYRHEPDISTFNEGTVERLENGNSVINWGGAVADGAPIMTEVDSLSNLVYEISCTSKDIRAYIEKVMWSVEDNTIRDTVIGISANKQIFFNDSDSNDFGISMTLTSFAHFSDEEIRVSYCNFAPVSPVFQFRTPNVIAKKFTIEEKNISGIGGTIFLDSKLLDIPNPGKVIIYYRSGNGKFKELATKYLPSSNIINVNIGGFGDYIFCYSYTKDTIIVPVAPILNEPEDNEIVNQYESIKLNWTPIGFIQQFIVEIATDVEFQNIIDIISVSQKDYFEFIKQVENEEYFWRVLSVNEYGAESEWSEIRKFTTSEPYLKMTYPNGGELLHKKSSRNIIRWDKNTDDTVRIELHKNGEFVSVIRDDFFTTTDAYPWTIAKIIPLDTGYTIKIISLKDSTLFAVSENSFSIIDTTVGINDKSFNSELSISNYPNPAQNSTGFEFYIPVSGDVQLNIFNIKGEMVANVFNEYFDSGNHYFDWNPSKLVSGEYYCRLSLNGFYVTCKLLIFK